MHSAREICKLCNLIQMMLRWSWARRRPASFGWVRWLYVPLGWRVFQRVQLPISLAAEQTQAGMQPPSIPGVLVCAMNATKKWHLQAGSC